MRETISKLVYGFSFLLLVTGILLSGLWFMNGFGTKGDMGDLGLAVIASSFLATALFLGTLPSFVLYLKWQTRRDFHSLLMSSAIFLIVAIEAVVFFQHSVPHVQVISVEGTSASSQ